MKRVLTIDGGGIRGILPARLLVEVQKTVDIAKTHSLISGTSTGGIMAAGLVAGVPPTDILDLYVKHGTEVFDSNPIGGLIEAKYRAGKLEGFFKNIFGAKRLSDIISPEILVPSYCCKLPAPTDTDGDGVVEGATSMFFRSWKARADSKLDWPLWEVCRATSAAPTYFSAATIDGGYVMVDGGVFANNPAMSALASAWNLWPGEEVRVLSLGTGSKVDPINAGNWGGSQWLSSIFSVFMDGAADAVSYQCTAALGSDFLRCEIALEGVNDAFDDASTENITALQDLAEKFTTTNIDRVLAFLK